MYSAKIENLNGEVMLLTENENKYQIIDITGLNPPKAQINTTAIVGVDGAKFNSSKLDTRNIVITLRINGDVEASRLELYQYFVTKELCTFYYSNGRRNVKIVGYVDSIECDLFSNAETAQISILCPNPYFKDLNDIVDELTSILPLFTFPFSIYVNYQIPFSSIGNQRHADISLNSDSETGMIITATVNEALVSSITVTNERTGKLIKVNYSYQADDILIINTNVGEKSVKLIRNGTTFNLLSYISSDSTFIQLVPGRNIITSSLKISVKISHRNNYRGV